MKTIAFQLFLSLAMCQYNRAIHDRQGKEDFITKETMLITFTQRV